MIVGFPYRTKPKDSTIRRTIGGRPFRDDLYMHIVSRSQDPVNEAYKLLHGHFYGMKH